MRNQLIEWFEWNSKANQLFIAVFERNSIGKESMKILSQIIKQHEIWLNRICAISQPVPFVDASDNVERFSTHNALLHAITKEFLSSESYGNNFGWTFFYNTEYGKRLTIRLEDAYFQILTSSEFHRGQLAKLLSENGVTPPDADYFSVCNRSN